MKRIIAALLCVALLIACFAGCGKEAKKKGDGSTITIGICTNALIEDYDTNLFTKYLEKETGYKIEFQFLSSAATEAQSQISTMMAAGETLPDIIYGVDLGRDVYIEYGEDGYFLDLQEYFDDKDGVTKVFWDRFAELPKEDQETFKRTLVVPDTGAIYALPSYQVSDIDPMDYQLYINKDWLDKLGMKMPTNLNEFYAVLKAFKTNDLNGNGMADEIPLIGNRDIGGDIVNYFINQFIYNDDNKWFTLDEKGKLMTPFTTSQYREGLKYANKLYSEGLLYESSLTMYCDELKSVICPQMDGSGNIDKSSMLVGCFAGHPTLCLESDNPAINSYEAMPYWSSCLLNPHKSAYDVFITEDCENVDAALAVCMQMYTKDASYRIRYGEKGVDWEDADKGTKSFLGRDAEIKVINQVWAAQNNSNWGKISSTILLNAENEVTQAENVSKWEEKRNQLFTNMYNNYYGAAEKYNPKKLMHSIVYTTEENEQYSMTMDNCQRLITQSRTSFVTGALDPNKDGDWNEYLKQLKDQGLDSWLSIAQKAYSRK